MWKLIVLCLIPVDMYARSKSEGKVIVRTSSDAAELLDLRDTYWKQVEKHK